MFSTRDRLSLSSVSMRKDFRLKSKPKLFPRSKNSLSYITTDSVIDHRSRVPTAGMTHAGFVCSFFSSCVKSPVEQWSFPVRCWSCNSREGFVVYVWSWPCSHTEETGRRGRRTNDRNHNYTSTSPSVSSIHHHRHHHHHHHHRFIRSSK